MFAVIQKQDPVFFFFFRAFENVSHQLLVVVAAAVLKCQRGGSVHQPRQHAAPSSRWTYIPERGRQTLDCPRPTNKVPFENLENGPRPSASTRRNTNVQSTCSVTEQRMKRRSEREGGREGERAGGDMGTSRRPLNNANRGFVPAAFFKFVEHSRRDLHLCMPILYG